MTPTDLRKKAEEVWAGINANRMVPEPDKTQVGWIESALREVAQEEYDRAVDECAKIADSYCGDCQPSNLKGDSQIVAATADAIAVGIRALKRKEKP